ncbi:MAG: hypothetical protein ACI3XP_02845 [Eubacteriales bacterium]
MAVFEAELQIAGMTFRIDAPFRITLPESFRPFQRTEGASGEIDCQITVHVGSMSDFAVRNTDIVQKYHWRDAEYVVRVESPGRPDEIRLFIPEAYAESFARSANWLLYLAPERALLRGGRIVLHASAVVRNGQAVVFTAPSGGGKSTQAQLWQKYLHAEPMNGDKIVLYAAGDALIASGSPIAGSSGIYRDLQAPVRTIVRLEKAPFNRLTPLSARESLLLLYGEAVKSRWDERFNQRLLSALEPMTALTEYYRFSCLPEPSAADCLLRRIENPS